MTPGPVPAGARRIVGVLAACLLVLGVFGVVTVKRPAVHHVLDTGALRPHTSLDEGADTPEVTGDTTTTSTTVDPPLVPSTTVVPHATTTVPEIPITTQEPVTGKSGIYVASSDGSGTPRRIVATNRMSGLSFSPDGTQLAYGAADQVWVVPTAGGLAHPVSPKIYLVTEPAWSPSGRYIAYSGSATGGAEEARVLDLTTGTEINLGYVQRGDGMSLVWRPQGPDVLAFFNENASLVIYDVAAAKTTHMAASGSPPLAWSPSGDAIAYGHQNNLTLFTFQDPVHFTESGYLTTLAPSYGGPHDPAWVGDEIYFVNPWRLDAVRRDATDARNVVSDYVGSLQYSAQRPDDLFVAVVPDTTHTEIRHIERVGLDGSGRRFIAGPPAGHMMYQFAITPQGDRIAFTCAGE